MSVFHADNRRAIFSGWNRLLRRSLRYHTDDYLRKISIYQHDTNED